MLRTLPFLARRAARYGYRNSPQPVRRLANKVLPRPASTVTRQPSCQRPVQLPAEPPTRVSGIRSRVTVVAVASNHQGRIEPFVAALRRQTHPPFDILILDNASTDLSFDEALTCATQDARLSVVSALTPLPLGDARRLALGRVTTDLALCLPIAELPDVHLLDRLVDRYEIASCRAPTATDDDVLGLVVRPEAISSAGGIASELIEAKPYGNSLGLGTLADFRGVVLNPAVRYHLDELVPLADEFGALGIDSVILLPQHAPESLKIELARLGRSYLDWPAAPESLPEFSAMVTLNDWGRRELLELASRRGVPIFAKVEGVQDFEDVDTGRRRHPYRRADYVLYQGTNDVDALPRTRGAIVGNTRLERIATAPQRGFADTTRIIINSNFTYNVLTDQRISWLDGVLAACERIGATAVISQHHADAALDASLPIAYEPMRHLLVEGDVLVSRFSTVPFEAMARGVPFVYHNPHRERVPTFANPGDAFLASFDTEQLAECLKLSLDWRGHYRERARPFFERQVNMSDEPSEHRAAKFIARTIERWDSV